MVSRSRPCPCLDFQCSKNLNLVFFLLTAAKQSGLINHACLQSQKSTPFYLSILSMFRLMSVRTPKSLFCSIIRVNSLATTFLSIRPNKYYEITAIIQIIIHMSVNCICVIAVRPAIILSIIFTSTFYVSNPTYTCMRIFDMNFGSWNIRYKTVTKTCRFCGFWSFLSIFEPVFDCFWIRKCFATDPDYGLSFWLQFLLKKRTAGAVTSHFGLNLEWN